MSKPNRITELPLTTNPLISDLLPLARPGSNSRVTIGTVLNSNFPVNFGNSTIDGDLFVNGNLRVSNLVTSSILYESGSTLFGNTLDDTHTFTGSLYVSGNINNVNDLAFDIDNTAVPDFGSLNWNNTDDTLNLGVKNGVTLQIGQELHYPKVVNKDTVDIVNGTLVMIRPDDITQGQRLAIIRWDGTQRYPSDYIVGVATEDIPLNQEGVVSWFGYIRGINLTVLENNGVKDSNEVWEEGQILYPHPTLQGGLTNGDPTTPNVKSPIAIITAINGINLTLLIRPKLGQRFDELYDVDFDTSVLGSLVYKTGEDSQWGTTEDSITVEPPHLILTDVSKSLEFTDDTSAAAGGVPLGGLYRNGNVIQIRIV